MEIAEENRHITSYVNHHLYLHMFMNEGREMILTSNLHLSLFFFFFLNHSYILWKQEVNNFTI